MPSGVYERTKPPWNKGLTKETDERLRKSGVNISKSLKRKNYVRIGMYGKHHSDKAKENMSKAQLKRKERDGYINSPEARKKQGNSMKRYWSNTENKSRMIGENNPMFGKNRSKETKKKISSTMMKNGTTKGINNPNWNPNRAEVYAPYGENFYNKNIRNRKWNLQDGRDMLTGTILDPNNRPAYHHIDYDKSNDDSDNHCFLSNSNHSRITGGQHNPIISERYKKILQENILSLKNGEIPKNWSQINMELFRQEKLKQIDLSFEYIIYNKGYKNG